MTGNPHPIFQDGVAVEKANARAYLPLRLGNPDALRALDGSTFWLVYIQTLIAFFYRDTSDTTSEDNGASIIVDGSGGIWKIISSGAGIAINAAGPLADRDDFDSEDPGFTYFGTDTSLLYVRVNGGGWSSGSSIAGAKGDKGDPGDDSTVPGPANTLEIGTVTGGDEAAASVTGDAPNQFLNLTLPKGDRGEAFAPDEVVPDLAGRDDFDDEEKNFAVLVEEDSSNVDLPTLYFKLSAASGDWSGGITFGSIAGVPPSGMVKSDGTKLVSASPNDDYLPATSGSEIQKADGSGGLTGATAGTDFMKADTTSTVSKGFTLAPNSIGTISSGTLTPDPALGNYQYYTNNGAHTLAAPSSDCAIDILITNGASAGSITFSGFTVASGNTGDALTTTNTNKFVVSIRRINSVSTYVIKALQ